MKKSLAKFALYVYTTYIVEDWSIYTKTGKFFIYPAWFVRAILLWFISPIFLPEYLFKQTSVYKKIKKIMDSEEYQKQLIKSMNFFKFN